MNDKKIIELNELFLAIKDGIATEDMFDRLNASIMSGFVFELWRYRCGLQ